MSTLMTKKKGQNYVLEFVALSLMGIFIVIGVFMLYQLGIKPLYKTNVELNMNIIENKIFLAEKLFSKYGVEKAVFSIDIPKKINNKDYIINFFHLSDQKSLLVKIDSEVIIRDISSYIDSDIYMLVPYITSSEGKIDITYNGSILFSQ